MESLVNLIGRTFLFLLSLNLFFGNIPFLTAELSRLGGFLVLVALSLFYQRKSLYTRELSLFLSTLLFYTIFHYVDFSSPLLFQGFDAIAIWYSALVTGWAGNPMTLGPSALGMKITVSVFCLSIASALYSRNKRDALLSLTVPFFANLLWLSCQKPLSSAARFFTKSTEILPFHTQLVLILFSALLLWPFIRRNFTDGASRLEREKKGVFNGIAGFFMICVAFSLLLIHPLGDLKSGAILFVDRGTDFQVPIYGKVFGKNAPGMFGILPHYLRMRGFDTKIVREKITEAMLTKASALVVFNPATGFSEKERAWIKGFVEEGGGLLVAGDHTDVNGIMKPINDLLAPFRVQLNFDTALPLKSGWADSLTTWNHPITGGLSGYHETGIWVGASLKAAYPSMPLISGKLGWADAGNYMNRKRAYLGDYKRSKDEPLGDRVLAVESRLKKGTVIVFGDTSTFQNGIIPETSPFIDRIITSLLSRKPEFHHQTLLFVVAIILISAFFLVIPVYREPLACVVMMVAIPLSLTVTSKVNERFIHSFPFSKDSFYRPALIDTSHMPKMTPLASSDESVWGITLNLMRNRMIPLYLKDLDSTLLAEGKPLFILSPTQPFSEKEIAILEDYMKTGGTIVWAVGWEDVAPSADFLKKFHLSLDAVPLGSCEIPLEQVTVRFVDAWPIITQEKSAQVLVKKWGYPVVVFQPVGKGGLLLIGDSEFLLSANLESYKTFNMNNIRFFGYLMRYLSGDAPVSVFKEKEGAGE